MGSMRCEGCGVAGTACKTTANYRVVSRGCDPRVDVAAAAAVVDIACKVATAHTIATTTITTIAVTTTTSTAATTCSISINVVPLAIIFQANYKLIKWKIVRCLFVALPLSLSFPLSPPSLSLSCVSQVLKRPTKEAELEMFVTLIAQMRLPNTATTTTTTDSKCATAVSNSCCSC